MDILIELIIWLVRRLFGEQEPQAPVGPRSERRSRSSSAGEYIYGDGTSDPSPSVKPKTLAELLEEARRQVQTPQATSQPSTPKAEPAPVAPRPITLERRTVVVKMGSKGNTEVRTNVEQALPPIPPPPPPAAPTPAALASKSQSSKAQKRKQEKADKKRAATPATWQSRGQAPLIQAGQPIQPKKVASTPRSPSGLAGKASPASAVLPWVESLRSAKGPQKALSGARAMVTMEIFGKPRCMRNIRAGGPLNRS